MYIRLIKLFSVISLLFSIDSSTYIIKTPIITTFNNSYLNVEEVPCLHDKDRHACLVKLISDNNKEFHNVVDDYVLSDTVWFYKWYKDQGLHTGNDYETRVSVNLYAPISGYIIKTDDSVKRSGYLGSTDGELLSGGGNAIYMIGELDNKVYGFIMLHCQDIYVEPEDFVLQDRVIGTTGNTGDTKSYHVHLEMYYLGDGEVNDYKDIDYDFSFNLGRGQTLYKNRCTKKKAAPCILDSKEYIGVN